MSTTASQNNTTPSEFSPKKRLIALILAFFLGGWGAHRFYVGKIQSGLVLLGAQITLHVLAFMAMANFATATMTVVTSDAFVQHMAVLEAQANQTNFNNVAETVAFARLLLATPVASLHMYAWMFNILGLAALAIGLFVLVDFVKIAFGKFTDEQSKIIKTWY